MGDGLQYILDAIGAAAALGTAASGLVDTTKAFWGGVSNVGFKSIETALSPFAPALADATGADWVEMLRAHWINGVSKDEQKTKAKSLIRLGLSSQNAAAVAGAGRVDPARLKAAIERIQSGEPLQQNDVELFGRFDAAIDATVDAALERADQQYRNVSKSLAAAFAIVLAVGGGIAISDHYDRFQLLLSFVIGAVSVPLAPIAKDLASSLQTAAKAVKAVGG